MVPARTCGDAAHEAGAVIARAADRLAQFDRVLGLEMRAGEYRRCRRRARRRSAFSATADRSNPSAPDAGPSRCPAAGPRPWGSPDWAARHNRSRWRPAPRYWRRHRRRAGTPPAGAGRRRAGHRAGPPCRVNGSGSGSGLSEIGRRFMQHGSLLAMHEFGRGQEQHVAVGRALALGDGAARWPATGSAPAPGNSGSAGSAAAAPVRARYRRAVCRGRNGPARSGARSRSALPSRPDPTRRFGHGIAVRRFMAVKRLAHAVQPVRAAAGD